MKKLSSSKLTPFFLTGVVILLFFLPRVYFGLVPIPSDALLGLYHPFRDVSFDGFSAGKFPVKNPLITDPVLQTYPWKKLVVDNFKNLDLPFWNPYSFSGQPLLANIQSAPFQIANLLFFVFPFNIAWTMHIILPLVLTSFFMFLFLRSLELSKISSVFGAFILPFSGYFVAWMTWGGVTTTAMFLPLVLLCISKLSRKFSLAYFLILIFSLSQIVLSGHWQTGSYIFLTSILFTVFKYFSQKSYKPILIIGAAFVLGLLISSAQILPSLEFLNFSTRDIDQSYYEGRKDWFIPYQHLIQILAPDFFGNPTTYNYWGVFNWGEFVGFIGIIPLVLSGVAVLCRRKQIGFLLILLAVSLIIGLKNPISIIPYSYNFPFISSMQPSRIIFLLTFSLVTISAFGLESLLKGRFTIKFILPPIFVLGFLLILALISKYGEILPTVSNLDTANIAFRNLILPIAFSILSLLFISFLRFDSFKKISLLALLVLTLFELYRFTYKFTPFSEASLIFPKTEIINYLSTQQKPFRVMATDRRILHPNVSSVYKIESTSGYDPLFLNDYAKFVSTWEANNVSEAGSFNRIVTPTNYESKLADLLNVKYVLSFDEINDPKMEKILEEGQTKLYENKNVLPRAFFVNEVVRVTGKDQELSKMLDEKFDLANSAVSSAFSFKKQENDSSVSITEYSDQALSLSVDTLISSHLVLSNVFYPGWDAYIDEKKSEIQRVNYMFQTVIVPEGKHDIEFRYEPRTFYNGLRLSALGIFLTLGVTFLLWRKKYR